MRNFFKGISLVGIILILFSCNGKQGETIESTHLTIDHAKNLEKFEEFTLRPYGINAIVYLPQKKSGINAYQEPEVLHEMDGYEWYINVSPDFTLKIEDWGDLSFEQFLKSIEQSDEYKLEYLNKESDFVVYTTALKSGEAAIKYHAAGFHVVDGIRYIFRSGENGCNEKLINLMATSVKNVEIIEVGFF